MSGLDKDTVKIAVGVFIGVIGIGAISAIMSASQEKKKHTSLGMIGKAIGQIGEILSDHEIKEPTLMKEMEKKIEKNENKVAEVIDWVATGFQLWKKIKN